MLVLIATTSLVGAGSLGWWAVPGLLLGGLGFGLFIPPLTDFVLAEVGANSVGPASGALTSLQQIGGALGVTIISMVFFGVLDARAAVGPVRGAAAYADAFIAGLVVEAVLFALVAALVLALPRTRPVGLDTPARAVVDD